MIRVLVAEDHPVVRNALAQLLGAVHDITVVGTASDGDEAVAAPLEHPPDVVLMDLEMPEKNGIEATQALATAGSEARVVILTTFADRRRILAALDAGAVGYLLKDAEHDEISAASWRRRYGTRHRLRVPLAKCWPSARVRKTSRI